MFEHGSFMKKTKLVLFDIDGTLVKGRHPVSEKSMSEGIRKIFNVAVVYDLNKYDGSTDRKIMVDLARQHGINQQEVEKNLTKLAQARTEYFSSNIDDNYKKLLIKPAVYLAKKLKEKGVHIGLLTGNFSMLAKKKLMILGIDNLFNFGLFGEMAENRNKLAALVFNKSKQHFGINFKPNNIYIIGDTPKDIECGKVAGVKTIGVTTGKYSKEELKKAKADLVVDSLDDKKVLAFIYQD